MLVTACFSYTLGLSFSRGNCEKSSPVIVISKPTFWYPNKVSVNYLMTRFDRNRISVIGIVNKNLLRMDHTFTPTFYMILAKDKLAYHGNVLISPPPIASAPNLSWVSHSPDQKHFSPAPIK